MGDGETKHWEDAMSFRAALDAITEKFVTDFNDGNAVGCAAGYTEDAISYWAASHVLRGRKEIEQHYVDLLAGGAKLTSLDTVHAEGSENLGYAIQTYAGNQGAGMVMLAIRRSADGKWAVSAEAITAS
jgi:ketosteroid isomerase-like protein